ncbi:MAG TPA: hypothetical protein DCG57_14720, partial [Candidatus Riflebacteria bacterium]|nr:hypothetical protein [Candidatus Riflebacteria bacterium]
SVTKTSPPQGVYQNQNPDISVTGVFTVKGSDDRRDPDRNSLKLDGTELNFSRSVSPYTRANATIGFHDNEAHVEEAYADISHKLPGELELRIGRFLVPMGHLNKIHPHDWPFVSKPLINSYFYGGDHGYSDDGLSLSKIIDLKSKTYVRLNLDALNGNNSRLFNTGQTRVYGGRLFMHTPFNDKQDMQLGANYHDGAWNRAGDLSSKIYGADLMLRHRIDQFNRITLWGEWVWNEREQLIGKSIDSHGYYVSSMYKFRKDNDWHVGLSYDCSEKPGDSRFNSIARSAYLGYWLTENDRLQLQFRKLRDPFVGRDNNEIWLQFIWGIGPHKPHLANF